MRCMRARVFALGMTLCACGRMEGRVLQVVERVQLGSDSSSTVAVDSVGRHWLGSTGALQVRDSAGDGASVPAPGAEAPRVLGWIGRQAYLRVADEVAVVELGADSALARRGGFGVNPVSLDVRGRVVLEAAASGAVIGYDPGTLEPLWAWPALAQRSTALAVSPEGDRVYQALGTGEQAHRVLIRDLQSGRVLSSASFPAPFRALVTDDDGVLYGIVSDRRGAAVLALRPRAHDLELVWRVRLPASEDEAEMRIDVRASRVLVWGSGVGLRLIDASDGTIIGRTRTDPLDATLDPGGELWALFSGELQRLR